VEYGDSKTAMEVVLSFFPQRAIAVMVVLAARNKVNHLIPKWREDQMIKLTAALTFNVGEMVDGFRQKRVWKLAWAARNLLELNVWIRYCDLSLERANQFRADAARDLLGVSKVIQSGMERHTGFRNSDLDRMSQELVTMVDQEFGVAGIDDDFTKVSEAARELGLEKDFAHTNRLLSKYAHPSALALNSVLPESAQFDEGTRNMFLCDGVEAAVTGLTVLRDRVKFHYPDIDDAKE
jgi:hypothetical protein